MDSVTVIQCWDAASGGWFDVTEIKDLGPLQAKIRELDAADYEQRTYRVLTTKIEAIFVGDTELSPTDRERHFAARL